MAGGLSKRFMSIEDIANLAMVEPPKKWGSYKKEGKYMRRLALFLFLTIAGFHSSCNSEVAIEKEVFDKVNIGMTKSEVKSILGEPFDIRPTDDSLENYFYRVRHSNRAIRNAVIEFDKSGYVCFFSAGLAS